MQIPTKVIVREIRVKEISRKLHDFFYAYSRVPKVSLSAG